MIDKFGNAFYLIIYLAHFIIVGSYAYQLVFDTKKFLKGRGVDKTATLITRFAGSFMIATVLMAIYIAFIRSGGVEATWAFDTINSSTSSNLIPLVSIRLFITGAANSFIFNEERGPLIGDTIDLFAPTI